MITIQKLPPCRVKLSPNLIVVVEEAQDRGSMAKPPHTNKADELVPCGVARPPQHLDFLLLVIGGVWRTELDCE